MQEVKILDLSLSEEFSDIESMVIPLGKLSLKESCINKEEKKKKVYRKPRYLTRREINSIIYHINKIEPSIGNNLKRELRKHKICPDMISELEFYILCNLRSFISKEELLDVDDVD